MMIGRRCHYQLLVWNPAIAIHQSTFACHFCNHLRSDPSGLKLRMLTHPRPCCEWRVQRAMRAEANSDTSGPARPKVPGFGHGALRAAWRSPCVALAALSVPPGGYEAEVEGSAGAETLARKSEELAPDG